MTKTFLRQLFAASAVACLIALTSLPGLGQDGSSSSAKPEVTSDLRHDRSPALGDIEPVRPKIEEANHEIPLGRLSPSAHAAGPATSDSALQPTLLPAVAATTGLNFDGVGANGSAPSDSNLAVGPTQVVEWVNSEFEIFDKATGASIYGPVAGNTPWSRFGGDCETQNNGDPIVQYDKINDRWVLAQPVFSPLVSGNYSYCVAVSTTSDATGTYNRYQFPESPLPDYPKMGIWPDAYYASFNLFTSATGGYVSPRVCAMDSASMRAGVAATQVCFNATSSDFSLLPSDFDGTTLPPPGEPNLLLEIDLNSNTNLKLFKFHVDFATPSSSTFTGPTNITSALSTIPAAGPVAPASPNPGPRPS